MNKNVYEIDCSNCKSVHFGEPRPSLTSSPNDCKRSVKNKIRKHYWKADYNFSLG